MRPLQWKGHDSNYISLFEKKFVGWEINPVSFNRTVEVLENHVDASADNWSLFNGCGCEMKEFAEREEVFDGVFTSPPYYMKAEPYNNIEGTYATWISQDSTRRLMRCLAT